MKSSSGVQGGSWSLHWRVPHTEAKTHGAATSAHEKHGQRCKAGPCRTPPGVRLTPRALIDDMPTAIKRTRQNWACELGNCAIQGRGISRRAPVGPVLLLRDSASTSELRLHPD